MGNNSQDSAVTQRRNTAIRITRIYRQYNHIRILPYFPKRDGILQIRQVPQPYRKYESKQSVAGFEH